MERDEEFLKHMNMLFRDWPQIRLPAVPPGRLLVLLLLMVNALTPVSAQRRHAPWYSVRVERQPALTVITFAIDDGAMRVNLPRTIVGGQRFFGTVTDERGFGQVTAYSLEFADQIAAQASMFSWVAPKVDATTHVPLIFSDFTGKELARADVTVTTPSEKSLVKPSEFPRAIQSGHPVPYSGPFDGFGWNTTVTIARQKVPILAQTLDETIVLPPADVAGTVRYSVKTSVGESSGEVRCVRVQEALTKGTKRNRPHYDVVISGLAGLQRELGFLTQNYTPTIATVGPLLPVPLPRARPDVQEQKDILFVEPGDVPPNGIFHASARPNQIQPGEIDIRTELVMPQNELEDINLLIQAPRRSWSKAPEQEHAERLRTRYGDRALGLLDQLVQVGMNPDLAINAMVTLDLDRATPLVLTDVKHHLAHINFEIFTGKMATEPSYPYRQLLHDAAMEDLLQRPSISAADAVALTGSPTDLPSLATVFVLPSLHPMIRDEVEAAMARFGDAGRRQAIEARLKLVITQKGDNVQEFERGAHQAGLTGDLLFIPLLCRHLKDPSWDYGDYGVAPASNAAAAIRAIQVQVPANKRVSNPCENEP